MRLRATGRVLTRRPISARNEENDPLVDQLQVAPDREASVEALELLYRERFHQFVRVAQAITRSQEAAVDAVQEAFASALRDRAAFRGEGRLEAWVWRIVVNAAQRLRQERAHSPLAERDEAAPELARDEAVRVVIASLPERQRLVLFLRYYADLDYRSIGECLQMEVGTVGSTLSQAQRALRQQLAEAGC
jgi:RNA polymerase sigma-70 factor (ECF subfamily)